MSCAVKIIAALCFLATAVNSQEAPCPEGCVCPEESKVNCTVSAELTEWPINISTSVQHIDLRNNNISSIASDALVNFTQLISLKLDNNRLSNLTLRIPQSLRTLTLSGNDIQELDLNTTEDGNLTSVDLDGNKIEEIPHLPSTVQSLSMCDNRVAAVQGGVLANLVNLKDLHLSNNSIQTISNDAFDDLNQLVSIDLSLNQYQYIYVEWFQNKTKLSKVQVRTENLNCTCETFRSYYTLNGTELDVNDLPESNCSAPESLKGLTVENAANQNVPGCDGLNQITPAGSTEATPAGQDDAGPSPVTDPSNPVISQSRPPTGPSSPVIKTDPSSSVTGQSSLVTDETQSYGTGETPTTGNGTTVNGTEAVPGTQSSSNVGAIVVGSLGAAVVVLGLAGYVILHYNKKTDYTVI